MIESVAVRQRGAYDFETHYNNLCALQNSCPIPAVKAHLSENVLDINGDRIRASEWLPMLNTVRINKTLECIGIKSYYQQTLEDQEKRGVTLKRKTPAIRCKEITYRICKSLKECLAATPALTCVELQGLPIRNRDLAILAKGIGKNATLRHLSLEYSFIEDEGLEIICHGVKNSISVTSLNFTGCHLTSKGAESLAKIIKHQAIRRHNEAWQDSLRYRRPDLDRMPGVRRISVNCNPLMGDAAATVLADALKDDLWLKALDLQQCGVSDVGARTLLDVLKYNTTIVVLDIRQNPMIDQTIMHNIMEQVMINCSGQDTEYKWIAAEPLQDPDKMKSPSRKKKLKALQTSFGKKTSIKVGGGGHKRSKSVGSTASRPLQPFNGDSVKKGTGLPWRTALRANRYRGYPPEDSPGKADQLENMTDASSPNSSPKHGAFLVMEYADETENSMDETSTDLSTRKATKVQMEQFRRGFVEEKSARAQAEEKVIELTVENHQLRQEVVELQTRRTILDDDRVLESIEASFQQFHSFLDLIRDAGLGQLITLAGIDQSTMTIPRPGPSKAGNVSQARQHIPAASITIQPPSGSSDPDQSQHKTSISEKPERETKSDGKIMYPHITPDNYQNKADPTMNGTAAATVKPAQKPLSRFDQLYQKVLKDTNGALPLDKPSHLGGGDMTVDSEAPSDMSHNSQGSPRSHSNSQDSHSANAPSTVKEMKVSSSGWKEKFVEHNPEYDNEPLLDVKDLLQHREESDGSEEIEEIEETDLFRQTGIHLVGSDESF